MFVSLFQGKVLLLQVKVLFDGEVKGISVGLDVNAVLSLHESTGISVGLDATAVRKDDTTTNFIVMEQKFVPSLSK